MCIMEQMDTSDYVKRIEDMEDDELEMKAANTAEFYIELLALYLCQNQLVDAKTLLLRMPSNFKDGNDEIAQLEKLLNALNGNNSSEFFKHVKYEWSAPIKAIIQQLKAKTLDDVFQLVALAYTSILEKNLMNMTQLSQDELKASCTKLGWSYEETDQSTIVVPVQGVHTSSADGESKEQLFKLTEFVTFLEN